MDHTKSCSLCSLSRWCLMGSIVASWWVDCSWQNKVKIVLKKWNEVFNLVWQLATCMIDPYAPIDIQHFGSLENDQQTAKPPFFLLWSTMYMYVYGTYYTSHFMHSFINDINRELKWNDDHWQCQSTLWVSNTNSGIILRCYMTLSTVAKPTHSVHIHCITTHVSLNVAFPVSTRILLSSLSPCAESPSQIYLPRPPAS